MAFGSTRRAGVKADDDEVLRNLVKAQTPVACIVAKSWDYHVTEALRTTLDEAVAMVSDSVEFLRNAGLEVFLDAEHFFDGYRNNPEFALRVLRAAHEAGASRLVLCDTNGGTLPHVVEQTVAEVRAALPDAGLGAHFHNDTGCAVANALAAVRQGAVQVQGCINGYGERTGNANLTSIIPNLTLKMGIETVPRDRLELLTPGVPPHRRARQPDARPAGALRRPERLRPQGRAAHQRHLPGPRRLRARRRPTPSAT